jgi:hypothetical protein
MGLGVRPGATSRIVGLALCAALVLGSETAVAQTGSRQSASASFVELRPGVPSALTFSVDYVNPDDPDGKPPAVRTVVETMARDARFDTSVPALCEATDAELMAAGAGACPPGSKVGSGYIRIDTGLPDPGRFIEVDVTFLNNTNQLIFLTTNRANGTRVIARGTIQGGRLTSNAPTLPGTPPDGAAIDVVQTRLDAISRVVGSVGRGYITTPAACPSSGVWTNTLSFTYADGVTQNVESRSPCLPPAEEPSSSGCLARRAPIGARNIGRVRLGLSRRALLRRVPAPRRRTKRSWRWCVKGGMGTVSAAFTRKGRIALVTTTAPHHGNRRIQPGTSAHALRRAYPSGRSIGRGLVRANPRSPLLFGIRRGSVRYVAVTSRRMIGRRGTLRAYLRYAGVLKKYR